MHVQNIRNQNTLIINDHSATPRCPWKWSFLRTGDGQSAFWELTLREDMARTDQEPSSASPQYDMPNMLCSDMTRSTLQQNLCDSALNRADLSTRCLTVSITNEKERAQTKLAAKTEGLIVKSKLSERDPYLATLGHWNIFSLRLDGKQGMHSLKK